MSRTSTVAASVLFFTTLGCGDDGAPSFEAISQAVEQPTGTVDGTNAVPLAEEFERASATSFGFGTRRLSTEPVRYAETIPCEAGGSIEFEATDPYAASGQYNRCCVEPNCCLDGTLAFYYSEGGAPSDFLYCADYDLSYACYGFTESVELRGCISGLGWVYAIELDGLTYSVSGFYAGGSGTLEIQDATGTWTCEYEDGAGSCSGAGPAFDF